MNDRSDWTKEEHRVENHIKHEMTKYMHELMRHIGKHLIPARQLTLEPTAFEFYMKEKTSWVRSKPFMTIEFCDLLHGSGDHLDLEHARKKGIRVGIYYFRRGKPFIRDAEKMLVPYLKELSHFLGGGIKMKVDPRDYTHEK